MALPELLFNSPTPGSRVALTTLNVELSEAGLEMEWVANVPTEVQKPGQFRVTIGSEIILCEAKAESTKKVKILERGAEGTTKVAHPATTQVWGLLTKGSLKAYTEGLGFETSVVMAHGSVATKLVKGGVNTTIKLGTADFDPGSNFDTTNSWYLVPSDGYYSVSGAVRAAWENGQLAAISIVGSSAGTLQGNLYNGNGVALLVQVAGITHCKKGDKLQMQAYNGGTSEPETTTDAQSNRLSVMRVGEGQIGPENKLVEESIAIAYRNAEQKIVSGGFRQVKVDKAVKDPGSNFDLVNGYYVVPADGYYAVSGGTFMKTKGIFGASIFLSGVEECRGSYTKVEVESEVGASVSGIIFAKKGEKIELYVEQASGAEKTLIVGFQQLNFLSVARVGAGPEGQKGLTGIGGPDEHGRSAEMASGKITITAPGVTATGTILISVEGTVALAGIVVVTKRNVGESFVVESSLVTSTDRVNWAVWK